MKYLFLFILISFHMISFSQKPVVDESALANWPGIGGERISNDGKYVLYSVFSKGSRPSLFIRSRDNAFQREISRGRDAVFTEDSRRVIYINPGDSLCILELSTNEEGYISHVRSFKLQEECNPEWLAYLSTANELILQNLLSEEKKIYPDVREYSFSKSGKVLLLQRGSDKDSIEKNELEWIDLVHWKETFIWKGGTISNVAFDQGDTQVAFLTQSGIQGQETYSIWHYQECMDSARPWVDDQAHGMGKGFVVAREDLKFSPDGKKLFFKIRQCSPPSTPDPESVSVDIWNYLDEWLQSEQLNDLEGDRNRTLRAMVNVGDAKILRLEQAQDSILAGEGELNDGGNDDYLLAENKVNTGEGYRRMGGRPDFYLISTKDGSRTCIQKHLMAFGTPHFSPGGKYVLWYDLEKRAFYTYNILNGVTKNITNGVPFPVYNEIWDVAIRPYPYDPAVWLQQDSAILICDRYDIWKVNPNGVKLPVNITNGYGRRNKTVLRYVYTKGQYYLDAPAIRSNDNLLLCGFNETTKDNGFFRKQLNVSGDPKQLILSASIFYFPVGDFSQFIMKAKGADVYVVKRMSATEFPNLQVTKDFTTFTAMSELEPQKRYNWLTSELVRWTTFDGHPGEGILYKPEDFDPSKKYPIIFYFYERLTERLNKFIEPELSGGPINIPWFVSRGYLVFCPDIYYKVGEPGESVYNYVVSGAKMIAQKPWVDGKRMGIQGHSWGGYEVNYLVTRTKLFAAAASASGATDFVSLCGTLTIGGEDPHIFTEQVQCRMGVTLWQNPAAYVKNSPVFGADKVTTPLLIMHNKKDGRVPWSQGVELFTSLRRLGKPSWMLQYDEGGHGLDGNNSLDYAVRLMQFFNHFLKGSLAPKWMISGVPARLKGIENGIELPSKENLTRQEKPVQSQ